MSPTEVHIAIHCSIDMSCQLTLESGFLRSSKYLEILSNNDTYFMGSDAEIDLSKLLSDECTYTTSPNVEIFR